MKNYSTKRPPICYFIITVGCRFKNLDTKSRCSPTSNGAKLMSILLWRSPRIIYCIKPRREHGEWHYGLGQIKGYSTLALLDHDESVLFGRKENHRQSADDHSHSSSARQED